MRNLQKPGGITTPKKEDKTEPKKSGNNNAVMWAIIALLIALAGFMVYNYQKLQQKKQSENL